MYQQRWLSFPPDQRQIVKNHCLGCFGTETERPSAAAQVVAYIAIAELPTEQWPELMQILVSNVANANSTEMLKVVTLEAIGYICLEIEPIEVLAARSNEILTVIVHCMRKEETSDRVRLAATNALQNSLEFSKANFSNDNERHYIMQVICETTQSSNLLVRVAALQCLVKIMSLYYQYMEHYMGPALFAISTEAIKSELDDVALQGIEFWSNVCEEEIDLAIEASEAADEGRPPQRTSMHYAKGAIQYLMPLLTHCLMKQDEADDEDEWNVCKAAGVCLVLLATCCEDSIIPHALPFVQANIKHTDWRHRDAAVMLFGSVLEGADSANTRPLADTAMGPLIQMLNDESVAVRDSTAWTLGRLCENAPDVALNPQYLEPLLRELIRGLSMEPRVATNVCWALNSLAQAAYTQAQNELALGQEPETYCLTRYFEGIITKLLETTERADGNQSNLRGAAYESLMEMMKNSPKDCYQWVQSMTMVILQRINHILQISATAVNASQQEKSALYDLQSLLCATLTSVLRKMTPEDAPKVSDLIMSALLEMFKTTNGQQESGVQEDALMAVSTLVEVLGRGFLKYMDAFKPFLVLGLRSHQEHQVCMAAAGVCADISRSIGSEVVPYCDEIMTLLLEALNDPILNRCVKPQILSTFGDIALAIGVEIQKYAEVVLNTLATASQAQVDRSDFENIEYLNELRNGCLDAYTGILQGLKGENGCSPTLQVLLPHVPFIVQFVMSIARDPEKNDSLVATSSGLIGDLITTFGQQVLLLVDNETISELLTEGRRSRTHKTKSLSMWATKEIRKLKTQNN
ncbi:importin subunit beta-1-like isoform X2 [Varroa destructor]|nr:importin subunit beta-1-like isoform X2 [Varroa destructor]